MLREGQLEVYLRLIGLESALGQVTSNPLTYQQRLNALQADLLEAQRPDPVNQVQDLLPPPTGAKQMTLLFPFCLVPA